MLFSLAILLFTFPTVTAVTDLQASCTGPDRRYNGTSCYVLIKTRKRHSLAKLSCNHYLGYSGHLNHIRNAAAQATAKQLISTYSNPTDLIFTGLEPINSSAALNNTNNWAHYYRNGTFVSATSLPWAPGQPLTNNRVDYQPSSDKIFTIDETTAHFFICEYEEALKQTVTDLEQKCVNLMSGSVLTSFVNDLCYVLQPAVSKNYNDAKVSCNAISGYNGHLAHIRTMEELWIAEALRLASGASYVRIGIEQTNLSSTDPTSGWFLTTPTNESVLTTFLPWATSPTAGSRTIAVTTGYPKPFATVDSNTAYPFICQYGNTSTTTTSTATTTTATTTTGAACTTPLMSTAGGTGTTAATTYAERIASSFNHYRFGYFKNTCYWLDQLTVSFSKCLNMCHRNNLCFGLSYNAGTSDCQLLAIIASASPYWFELTADKHYETVVRE